MRPGLSIFILLCLAASNLSANCRIRVLSLTGVGKYSSRIPGLEAAGRAQTYSFRGGQFLVHQRYGGAGLGLFDSKGELIWSLAGLFANHYSSTHRSLESAIEDAEVFPFDSESRRFVVRIKEGFSGAIGASARLGTEHLFLVDWEQEGFPKIRPLSTGDIALNSGFSVSFYARADGSFKVLVTRNPSSQKLYEYQDLTFDAFGNLEKQAKLDTPRSISPNAETLTDRIKAGTIGYDEASDRWVIAESWDRKSIVYRGTVFRILALGDSLRKPVWLTAPARGTWHHQPSGQLIQGRGLFYDTGTHVTYLPYKNPSSIVAGFRGSISLPERGDARVHEILIQHGQNSSYVLVLGINNLGRTFIEKRGWDSSVPHSRLTFGPLSVPKQDEHFRVYDYHISIIGSALWFGPIRNGAGSLAIIDLNRMDVVERLNFDPSEFSFHMALDERRGVFHQFSRGEEQGSHIIVDVDQVPPVLAPSL